MEQVVLHLPDDMAELRQVATEDAVAVHPPQVAVDTLAALEQLDEQAGVADVVAELVVDQVSAVAQQANGVGAHALISGCWAISTKISRRANGVRLKTFGCVTSM